MTPAQQPQRDPGADGLSPPLACFLLIIALFCAAGVIGAPLCGLIALGQIRHSHGSQIGTGLALADTIVTPLLLLDILLIWVCTPVVDRLPDALQLPLVLALIAVLNILLARAIWRWARQPLDAANHSSRIRIAVV
jgi:hypothetical protein